jgi:hypothetical protein
MEGNSKGCKVGLFDGNEVGCEDGCKLGISLG